MHLLRFLSDPNSKIYILIRGFAKSNRNGLSGDAIVEALIANSSTFGKKTMQSQVSLIYSLVGSYLVF